MQQRIAYELSDERSALHAPRGRPLIVHIVVNVEVWPFDQPVPRGIITPPHGQATVPDVANWSWAEYGLRSGMPRFFQVLGDRKLPVSCAINSDIISVYPRLAERILKAGWEWIAHGVYQRSVRNVPDERAMIQTSRDAIAGFTGKPPQGWLGPGLHETPQTPDILHELGFKYLCEWCVDDLPSWMQTQHGRMVSLPYSLEHNDSVIYAVEKHSSGEMTQRMQATLDCYRRELKQSPRMLTIPLHPHLMGVPHRIGFLEKFLDRLMKRRDVVFLTGGQIADWFVQAGSAPAKAPVRRR